MAYNDIFRNFSKLIEHGIRPSFFGDQSNIIGGKVFDGGMAQAIYNSPESFLQEYKQFEQYYYEILADPANRKRSFGHIDIDMMRKTGDIDFSLLNFEAAEKVRKSYAGKVLKVEDLFANLGFPSLAFPSASPYRSPFKFEVSQEMLHPAQTLLNRMIFNIDPTSESIADIKFGGQNIMSSQDIERNFAQVQRMRQGKLLDPTKNIITLDVETTGILPGSQVREVSLKKFGANEIMAESFGYRSERFAGVLAGSNLSETLSEFVSKQSNLGNYVRSEEDFLKNMESVFSKLVEADQVAGHNINFDIKQMIRTASQMKGFNENQNLVNLIDQFLERKATDDNFIIDTLEVARSYMTDIVQSEINKQGLSGTFRGQQYMKKFFATESLADVVMGGKATYVGVENFAMNTNLLELMAQEKHAPEIFQKIFQGSHIAETDTILQDYILKYIHEKKLNFLDVGQTYSFTPGINQETIDIARKTVFKSQAVTPITNIADPRFLTESALNYVKGRGLIGVTAMAEEADFAALGIADQIEKANLNASEKITKGFIRYDKGEFKLFTGVDDISIAIKDQQKARAHLRALIDSALDPVNNKTIQGVGTYNVAEKNIISLGVNFTQNQSMEMMKRALSIETGQLDVSGYIKNIGNLYESFGDALTYQEQKTLRRASSLNGAVGHLRANFSIGLNSVESNAEEVIAKQLAHSNAMLSVGNKYGYLSVTENILSNILSQATASTAQGLYQRAATGGIADEALASNIIQQMTYASSQEMSDITSQFNISHFIKQKVFYIMPRGGEPKKMLLSFDYFRSMQFEKQGQTIAMADLLSERKVGFSLSLMEKLDAQGHTENLLNLTWQAGRDASKITSEDIARKLYTDFMDDNNTKAIAGLDTADAKRQIVAFRQIYGQMDQTEAVNQLTKLIEERGVGIGYTDVGVDQIVEDFARQGVDLSADAYNTYTVGFAGETEDVIQAGAVRDYKSVIGAGAEEQIRQADMTAVSNANAVGKAVSADPQLKKAAISNLRAGRQQAPVSTAVEMYHAYKGKAGIAALGLTALAGGYYMFRKRKENQLYDETLEKQPTENFRQTDAYNNYTIATTSYGSTRRDPLVTAGVVGNLDRRKIGHTQMGNNKYNHLYGA